MITLARPEKARSRFLLGRAIPGQSTRHDTYPSEGACQDTQSDEGACEDAHPGERGEGRGGWAVNAVLVILRDPWCVTVIGQDGTAVAHGCIPGRCTLADITSVGAADARAAEDLAAALKVRLLPVARGACEDAHAEPGYRPSRRLPAPVTWVTR